MSYIINFIDTDGNEGSVIADGGFFYTDRLNHINESEFVFSGSGALKRSLIAEGSIVKVKRNGVLEFQGLVDDIEYYSGGAMRVHASGYEVWLAKENGIYANSPWTSTASASIFSEVIGESNYFTAGTINSGTSIDFRANISDSLWNVINNLKMKTTQDIQIDYPNLQVDILNHKGSSSSIETLNSGIQIGDPRVTKSYPIGNKIKVYGQSEGQTRIESDDSKGQDASSQSTYGVINYIIRDRTITTVAEANLLANAEVARLKDPRKIYSFDVLNPAKDWISGDVITINALSQAVSNEEVRIVEMKRGIKNDEEFLETEVTNKEFSERTKHRDEVIAELDKKSRDSDSYDLFPDEYTNQHIETSIGGFGCIGNNICGCSGDWFYLDGSFSAPSGIVQMQTLNVNTSSAFNTIDGDLIMTGIIENSTAPTLGCHLTNKTYVDMLVGGGTCWQDAANPYIVTCNSCHICVPGIKMTGDICDANSSHSVGVAGSPGAFKEMYAACGIFTTCVESGVISNPSGIDICNSAGKVADFGTNCTCLGTTRTKSIHAFSNGGCFVGISSCRFAGGYMNCFYACRKLVLPVGTNCY